MKRELKFAIIIFIFVLISFIFLVKYTENINNNNFKYSTEDVYHGYSQDKIINYQKSKVNLWLLNSAWGFIIPLMFLITGFSSGLRNGIQRNVGSVFIAVILFFGVYSAVSYILSLPLEYYGEYYLKHSYGLSNQDFLKWFNDSFKGFLINTLIGSIAVFGVFMIIRRSPCHWWLYTGLLAIPALFFLTFITPVYIDPLFNKYESISSPKLEASIKEELKAAGVEGCSVYMVNKSMDTKEMNAYMTGVLSTKRIVLWDTTINSLTQSEVLSVTAHEIGHYVMGHVWKAIVLGGVLSIVLLFITNKAVLWVIAKSGGVFGFNSIKDIAVMPLIIFSINLMVFLVTPGVNAYSRYTEREADRFELELTKDTESALSSTMKLHQESLIIPTPGPVYMLWTYDHPAFQERIDFAKSYAPWKEGKPLRYEKYFEIR